MHTHTQPGKHVNTQTNWHRHKYRMRVSLWRGCLMSGDKLWTALLLILAVSQRDEEKGPNLTICLQGHPARAGLEH